MKCLDILGITRNDWWLQALREMPEIFRHYVKWLITQIACNIYTVCQYGKAVRSKYIVPKSQQ